MLQFYAELIKPKSAKSPRCMQVTLITNELTEAEAGKLIMLDKLPVKVLIEEVDEPKF